jgi:hypothetical protein
MADQKLSPPCASPKTELPSGRTRPTKRAAIYTRVSCADQHPETQVYDLRGLATFRRKIGLKNSRLARILNPFVDRNVIFCLTEFKSCLLSVYE